MGKYDPAEPFRYAERKKHNRPSGGTGLITVIIMVMVEAVIAALLGDW